MRLKDLVAVVTGGSRGIGRAIVKAFAAEGAKVVLVYRGSQAAAEEAVKEVAAAGGVCKAVQVDVADREAVDRCVADVVSEFGALHILVNNAGVIRDNLIFRMPPEDFEAVIRTNLFGTFYFCRVAAEQMVFKQKRERIPGRIINLSSVAAEHVNQGQTNYAASKGAINAFTRSLAVEVASRNVTVNAIAPGFIATDMSEAVRNKAGDLIEKKFIPMKRIGKPEDIARVAVFLASEDAGYMTGQVLTVDGGLSLGAVAM
jgi:3-oxoacyl-[acyl-carrier protein] reductase